ncbi:PTS system mannose/fructose/sorbose family transporter subunit IID [Lentilactobacillus hilgardii]|uniref:PTS system mannose/fructose/sorbose family transporter subunit IID n=1 Tax=Lentilactobacillus hilgardii TaxID=1588 RepID=UPI0021C3609E|nr:PTS system mannose/fructose/sorbose family transporter subunit IID [Lentilactobacillus hilgardii]MCP9334417.1 PTS system mannose/fructose/sorbose family transporter subunit IID [Lentilactobacillus hilgardii]MCP9351000.1 PTS system mannose/fructose/sorbose family transporter subunit IID [Lentilactobacillus hilgardii]
MNSNKIISQENKLTKKDFGRVFWRSFTVEGSMNYERMEALGFLFSITPILKKIYKDDVIKLKEAMHRHLAAFNMTVAPSPFIMGITIAMEELAKKDKSFNVSSINAVKVSLMGPLSGIGDTFFWGIFRVLACAMAIGFAKQGNFLAPFILLFVYNIPNFLTRWYGLKLGYNNGSQLLENMEKSGKTKLFTFCAGIVGVASIGCMVALWLPMTCPLQFDISGTTVKIQKYLNEILPKMLPMAVTLGIFTCIRRNIKIYKIILVLVIVGFVLGVFNILK